ncbi:hypothetical protein P7C70_g3333, partial [Phenoliferia sp. Uapishka_3]
MSPTPAPSPTSASPRQIIRTPAVKDPSGVEVDKSPRERACDQVGKQEVAAAPGIEGTTITHEKDEKQRIDSHDLNPSHEDPKEKEDASESSLITSIRDHFISDSDSSSRTEKLRVIFPEISSDDRFIEGWETSLSIPWSEITRISKSNTALVIPNAIIITTPSTAYTFASFLSRDSAHTLFVSLWQRANEEIRTNNVRNGEGEGDFGFTGEDGEKRVYGFHEGSKISKMLKKDNTGSLDETGDSLREKDEASCPGRHSPTSYPGPTYTNPILSAIFPTSPALLHSLMFTNHSFLTSFLADDQGAKELKLGEWKDGKRLNEYIEKLNSSNPLAPKETRVEQSDCVEKEDGESWCEVRTEIRTPDVPSGNNFTITNRSIITWSESGGAHLSVTSECKWTKVNLLLKSLIESGSLEGVKRYHAALEIAMRKHIEENREEYSIEGIVEGEKLAKEEEGGPEAVAVEEGEAGLFEKGLGAGTAAMSGLLSMG